MGFRSWFTAEIRNIVIDNNYFGGTACGIVSAKMPNKLKRYINLYNHKSFSDKSFNIEKACNTLKEYFKDYNPEVTYKHELYTTGESLRIIISIDDSCNINTNDINLKLKELDKKIYVTKEKLNLLLAKKEELLNNLHNK